MKTLFKTRIAAVAMAASMALAAPAFAVEIPKGLQNVQTFGGIEVAAGDGWQLGEDGSSGEWTL